MALHFSRANFSVIQLIGFITLQKLYELGSTGTVLLLPVPQKNGSRRTITKVPEDEESVEDEAESKIEKGFKKRMYNYQN
ncbi:hypothetical protein [Oceanobacillus sp. CF4.6]|uniref:hypothetical protein n=1 Tax=Oceanobacillus sp. CF4.6 TaxID=3373080 RepID=UPI003EE51EAF